MGEQGDKYRVGERRQSRKRRHAQNTGTTTQYSDADSTQTLTEQGTMTEQGTKTEKETMTEQETMTE